MVSMLRGMEYSVSYQRWEVRQKHTVMQVPSGIIVLDVRENYCEIRKRLREAIIQVRHDSRNDSVGQAAVAPALRLASSHQCICKHRKKSALRFLGASVKSSAQAPAFRTLLDLSHF